jgi:hypothetical protein
VIRQRAANSSHCCIIHAANSTRIAYWGGVLCSDKILAQRSFRPAQILAFRALRLSIIPDLWSFQLSRSFWHLSGLWSLKTEAIEKGKRIEQFVTHCLLFQNSPVNFALLKETKICFFQQNDQGK